MKTLVVLFILFAGYAPINNKLDESNGFENFKFGTSFSDYKNLNIEIDEGNIKMFSVIPAEVNIKGIEFESIRLTFIKNHLTAIALTTKNSTGKAFLELLKLKYGAPKTVKHNYEWSGKKVLLIYETYDTGKDAAVNFYASAEK